MTGFVAVARILIAALPGMALVILYYEGSGPERRA